MKTMLCVNEYIKRLECLNNSDFLTFKQPSLTLDKIEEYQKVVGYRFCESIRAFYQFCDGVLMKSNYSKVEIYCLEKVVTLLLQAQKDNKYLKANVDGYHVEIGEHDSGKIILNVNKEYQDNDSENTLYLAKNNEDKWCGIKNIVEFLENYNKVQGICFWDMVDSFQYFDKITDNHNIELDYEYESGGILGYFYKRKR